MKTIITIIVILFATTVFAADVYQDKGTKEFKINFQDDKEIVVVVKDQKLKIHKCGKVEKMEWKEVIPNQEQTVNLYNGSDHIIWATPVR